VKFKTMDVRPVLARGDEPFPLIRAGVEALLPGCGLRVVAPFMPAPLVEVLRSEGLSTAIERRTDGGWEVSIWRE
jgi:hypothetical protein